MVASGVGDIVGIGAWGAGAVAFGICWPGKAAEDGVGCACVCVWPVWDAVLEDGGGLGSWDSEGAGAEAAEGLGGAAEEGTGFGGWPWIAGDAVVGVDGLDEEAGAGGGGMAPLGGPYCRFGRTSGCDAGLLGSLTAYMVASK